MELRELGKPVRSMSQKASSGNLAAEVQEEELNGGEKPGDGGTKLPSYSLKVPAKSL